MKIKLNLILVVIIVLMIPIVVISFKSKTNSFFTNEKKESKNESVKKEKIVKLKDGNKVIKLKLEDYIIGVVACEIPASFEPEALKAQAVASRTYALKKMNENNTYDLENSTNNQCYNSKEDMQKKWTTNYNKYYNKIKESVEDTKGEYITYNGKIINAFYFAMSNGYTEKSSMVFKEDLPYLQTVESNWEKENKNYEETVSFTIEDFLSKLGFKDNQITEIKIISTTESNRVKEIKINNRIFKATDFRKLLNLRSTDFSIVKNKENISITTRGYGHGVGMSQYGANGLAKENKNYKEILKYYYKDIEIKNV